MNDRQYTATNRVTFSGPPANHPHPSTSWKYLESKIEYPWAGGIFVYLQHVSYFLCLECGQVLRIVAQESI